MPTILMYKTVASNDLGDFDEQIRRLLEEDWQPYGNPYTGSDYDGRDYFLQAMVRYDDGLLRWQKE